MCPTPIVEAQEFILLHQPTFIPFACRFFPPSYCIAAPFSIEPGPPQNSTVSLAGWFFLPRSGYTIKAQASAGYHAHGFA